METSVPRERPYQDGTRGTGTLMERLQRKTVRLAAEVERTLTRARLVQGVAATLPQFCFNELRTALWRAAGFKIGEGSLVMGDLHMAGLGDWPSLFSVGEYSYITGPLRMDLGGSVSLGNGVNIGHDCIFLTVNHQIGPRWRRAGWSTYGAITVGDGAWLASRVTILPGVTIGEGAIVAAGAVVSRDVDPHTMVGGVPARVIRTLDSSWADQPPPPEVTAG